MSSKKSGSRAVVMERDGKPMEREGAEMNTKYVQETQSRQAQGAQKTQKARSGEKKPKEQQGKKEKAEQVKPAKQVTSAEQKGAAGQVHTAGSAGAAGQMQQTGFAGTVGQPGNTGLSGSVGLSGTVDQSGTEEQSGTAGLSEASVQEQTDLEKDMYLISETAKLVGVESHVLRYWEEELKLPIRRNELGHRYYTREDVEQFREIKKLKEQGLQLKAIRTVLTDSTLQVMVPIREHVQPVRSTQTELNERDDRQLQDKSARLQLLLHNLVAQAVRESNQDLTREIKETIMKEMDYQFRIQEEDVYKRQEKTCLRDPENERRLLLRSSVRRSDFCTGRNRKPYSHYGQRYEIFSC